MSQDEAGRPGRPRIGPKVQAQIPDEDHKVFVAEVRRRGAYKGAESEVLRDIVAQWAAAQSSSSAPS
jgi:hypothetical protein